MRQTKVSKWFFILVLLVIFSCSKENDLGDPTNVSQENFVGLSMAKEIGAEISFKSYGINPQVGKSTSLGTVKKKIKTVDEVKNDNGNTVFYVINYLKGGYIILSADNRAQPIIGFSEEGMFVVDKDKDASYPLGLESWVGNAKKQITTIQKSKIKQTENEKSVWNQVSDILISDVLVNKNLVGKAPNDMCYNRVTTDMKGPFLKSFWAQDKGYNDAMPYITCDGITKRALAGCVPIAMAQVMRHYEYPTNYDWSFIPINFSTDATANFILDVHNAIRSVYPKEPSYGCGATGVSNSCDMAKVLKVKFGYSSAVWANYDYQIVKSNIAEGKPVILSGFSSVGGHMWVCDGYQSTKYDFATCIGGYNTLYFHMNWGWEGKANGFFAYNNFSVSDTNDNISNTSFNKEIKMIYNIKP